MALQGSGTKEDPYLIGTPEELNQVRNNLSAHYKQVADIDMSGFVGFQPIGNNTTPFTGSYDGSGYKIINLSMSITSANNYVGMFGYVKGTSSTSKSILKNIHIVNPDFKATGSVGYMGILGGFIYTFVDLENIYIEGGTIYTYLSSGTEFGAVAGRCFGDTTTKNTIRNIIVKDFVYDINNSKVGGLFGTLNFANIENALSFPLSFRNTNNRTFLYSTSDSTFSKCYTISVSGSNGSGTTSVTTLPTGKSSSEYASLTFGIYEPINIVEGNYPYITFAGVSSERAIMISTESDLDYIRSNPSRYFKLVNDIQISSPINTNYMFNIEFTGDLDGNGYWIRGIDMPSRSGKRAIFNIIYGTIRNIGFDINNLISSNDDVSMITTALHGTLSNVNAVVRGQFKSGNDRFNSGFAGTMYNGSLVENCYVESSFSGGYSKYLDFVGIISYQSYGTSTARNNIVNVRGNPTNVKRDVIFVDNGVNSIDNVCYSDTNFSIINNTAVKLTSLTDFQNGNHSVYNNFDKEKVWLFRDGKNPIQRIFIKITEKIEERLIKSYSRIIKGFNNRFIGRFEKLISFSKSFKSKLRNKKIKFSNVTSFIKPLQAKLLSKKSKLSSIKSFSRPIKSNIFKLKLGLRNALSYSRVYISNIFNKKKPVKTVNTFINKIYATSFADMISKTLKKVKSFSRKINSNIFYTKIANIIKKSFSKKYVSNLIRYRVTSTIIKTVSKPFTSKLFKRVNKNFKVNSFSRVFFGKSLSKLARKTIRNVVSFSRVMRSRIWRFSNKFQFVIVTVKGGMKAIIGNVDRFATITKFVKSHTKKLTSWVSMFYIVASPQEVYAFIKATFRKVKLFKRENETIMNIKKHKTKISKSNK